ncbi:hypothetical protein DIPPA_10869 [Diplonema papillatum]|nr:hypothetical protein DIPPA_10869 [Diplonema papillatum]
MQVYLWLIFLVSVLEVVLAVGLLFKFSRVHGAVFTRRVRMNPTGHTCSVVHAYAFPGLISISQVLAWTGFMDEWNEGLIVLLLFAPFAPILSLYCMLKGSSAGKSAHAVATWETYTQYGVGDRLKYVTVGSNKKPFETGHHVDVVAGPPVAGLEVLEVLPAGYCRLLYPKQLFIEAIPGGASVHVGPFESITHMSCLAYDTFTGDLPPASEPKKGISTLDISCRYSSLAQQMEFRTSSGIPLPLIEPVPQVVVDAAP